MDEFQWSGPRMSKIHFRYQRAQLVFVPPAIVGNQVNIVATGANIINFLPEDGANLEDIFPQSSHDEKVNLLQR